MRISDWSSDVCSSDLSTLAARSRYGQDEAWRRPKKPKNQLPDEQGGPLDKPRKHFRGKFSVSPAMSSLPTASVVQRLNGLLQKQASPSARCTPVTGTHICFSKRQYSWKSRIGSPSSTSTFPHIATFGPSLKSSEEHASKLQS